MSKKANHSEECRCPKCAHYREMLEESIQDEICDAGFYAQIANEAPTVNGN